MLEVRFSFGDLVLALISAGDQGGFLIPDPYPRFITDRSPDVVLHHHYGDLPSMAGWQPVYQTNTWRLFQKDDCHGVELILPAWGPKPYRSAIFTADYSTGDLYTSAEFFAPSEQPFPLRYPLSEMLIINLLGQQRGILLHACAVRVGSHGLLFSGVSGAGKSTTARLWESLPGVSLLSDDRVILRQHPDGFYIYGTPWHGDVHAAAQDCVRLERIFVLRHASQNQAVPLRPVDLAARLFVRSFPPFWNPSGLAFNLQLLGDLSQAVPGHELGFVPDQTAVAYVQSLSI